MKVNKILSGITAVMLSTVSTLPSFSFAIEGTSYDTVKEYHVESFESEVPFDELIGEGVTGLLYYDDNTESVEVYVGDDIDEVDSINEIGSFTVRLTFDISRNRYYQSWEIHYPQLTYMSADIYCSTTSYPPSYYNSESVSQSYTGAYGSGYGQSYTYFSISSSVEKVRVGWTNCYISSVTDSFSVAPGSSIVYPEDLRP